MRKGKPTQARLSAFVLDPLYQSQWVFLHCTAKDIKRAMQTVPGLSAQTRRDLVANAYPEFAQTDGCAGRMSGTEGAHGIILWVRKGEAMSTIAHEAFHGVSYVLRERGVELNAGSDEAYAYYLQWVLDRWVEAFHEDRG